MLDSHPDRHACVILPARNEDRLIAHALQALYDQRFDRRRYQVLVLVNNSTDQTYAAAARFRHDHPDLTLDLMQKDFPAELAHVGMARSVLMNEAAARLDGTGVILSTDADTEVTSTWISENMRAIAAGADAVGGDIQLRPSDLDELSPAVKRLYLIDRQYQEACVRLACQIDPVAHDPWPRHHHHFGASLACTASAYRKVGGMQPVPQLEDVAFYHALDRAGARFRHAPEVCVYTSARLRGRAPVGLSWMLRHWEACSREGRPVLVDSAEFLEHSLKQRRDQLEAPFPPERRKGEIRQELHKLHAILNRGERTFVEDRFGIGHGAGPQLVPTPAS